MEILLISRQARRVATTIPTITPYWYRRFPEVSFVGEWAPTKATDADGALFRDSESFRPHRVECAYSYFSTDASNSA